MRRVKEWWLPGCRWNLGRWTPGGRGRWRGGRWWGCWRRWGVGADLVPFLRVPDLALQVVCEQGLGALQHAGQVVPAHQPVEVHGQLVVVQAVLHDVVAVLQQDGQAQEQHEGVPLPKLLGGRQGRRLHAVQAGGAGRGGLAPGEAGFRERGLTGEEEEEEALPKERMGEERRERLGAGQKDGEEREGLPVGVAGDVGVVPISLGANGEETCLPVVGGVGEGVAGDSALPLRKEKEVAGLAVAKAGALQLVTEAGDTAELLFQLGRQGEAGREARPSAHLGTVSHRPQGEEACPLPLSVGLPPPGLPRSPP
ncbi:hypothetical protein ANANG_G00250120 [Anguilla anguilla]|uniref:Uncharacterized protein n=1 Tax=Anguilla anguilla TaxID=7936 RepID=A0A9D3LT90_ANGAN|nr:hypothetical protein ANANG_G00250120 [Anguilla anguilla]